mgnify:CR=1 FL=1
MKRESLKREELAARTWLILVSAAFNRQTLTYKMVGERIELPQFAMSQVLG